MKINKKIIKPVIFILLIIIGAFLARNFDLGTYLESMRGEISDLGALGPAVFILIYAISTVVAIPASALTVFGGSLFGSFWGVIIVSAASTLGAALSFLVSRYLARDAVAGWFKDNEKFKRLNELTEKHGAVTVHITRLVPLFPFSMVNYGFGLTNIKFKTYVLFSWMCMLPGTILYVVGADAVTTALTQKKIPWGLLVIFVFSGFMLYISGRMGRKMLEKKEK